MSSRSVSAGYDAAKGDELGKMLVSPDGYAHMTHMLSALAGGKLLLALEGGYNVNSIAESAYACVKVIVGDELPAMPSLGSASLAATNTVADVKRFQAQYWKSMGYAVETEAGASACSVLDQHVTSNHQTLTIGLLGLGNAYRALEGWQD